MSNILKITVVGNPEYIKVCKNISIATAAIEGFDVDAVDEIGMAVYEACKIITCHGHDCWCAYYDLSIDVDESKMTIIIESRGEYTIEKCRKICLDCPNEGDLGVQVMRSVMDEVEIVRNDNSSKKIIMVKNLC